MVGKVILWLLLPFLPMDGFACFGHEISDNRIVIAREGESAVLSGMTYMETMVYGISGGLHTLSGGLECTFDESFPRPAVVYVDCGAPGTDDHLRLSLDKHSNYTGFTLTLPNVTHYYSGKLCLRVKGHVKTDGSPTGTLCWILYVLGSPVTRQPNDVYFVREGTAVRVSDFLSLSPENQQRWNVMEQWYLNENEIRSPNITVNREMKSSVLSYVISDKSLKSFRYEYNIAVAYGPSQNASFEPPQSMHIVQDGDTIPTIRCEVDCVPCNVVWTKHGKKLSETNTLSPGQATSATTGEYICTARNTITGQWTTKSLFIYTEGQTKGSVQQYIIYGCVAGVVILICVCVVSAICCYRMKWQRGNKGNDQVSYMYKSGQANIGPDGISMPLLKRPTGELPIPTDGNMSDMHAQAENQYSAIEIVADTQGPQSQVAGESNQSKRSTSEDHTYTDLNTLARDLPTEHQQSALKTRDVPTENQKPALKTRDVPKDHHQSALKTRDVPKDHQQSALKTRDVPIEHQQSALKTSDVPTEHQQSALETGHLTDDKTTSLNTTSIKIYDYETPVNTSPSGEVPIYLDVIDAQAESQFFATETDKQGQVTRPAGERNQSERITSGVHTYMGLRPFDKVDVAQNQYSGLDTGKLEDTRNAVLNTSSVKLDPYEILE